MAAEAARAYMNIGEVLALLRQDFPDATVSKIRFLESEGLIEPARAPSGYRRFTHADAERLRFILTAQRDHYLPLRVIKEHLDAYDRGDAPGELSGTGLRPPRPLVATPTEARPSPLLTRADLIEATDITGDDLDQLESYGLVHREDGRYPPAALVVARAAADLARYGIAARHLRAVKSAADREVALIEQAVAPLDRRRGPGARDRANETAREIATLANRLHTALVDAGLAARGG
jgi:DNA-binding transcriptional MerR regulator